MEAQSRNATMFTRLCYPYSPYSRGSLLKSLVAVVDNEAGDDTEECPLYTLPSPSHKGGEQYPDTPATKHRNTVII